MRALHVAVPLLVAGGFFAHRGGRRLPRALLWTVCVFGVLALDRLLAASAPSSRMAGMSLFVFLLCKLMVAEEERRDGMAPLPPAGWLAFTLLWVGMRPRLFARRARRALPDAGSMLLRGAACAAGGILLAGAARRVGPGPGGTALLIAALLLVFHFGACTLLAALWRLRGVRCEPVVRAPTRSQSLTEFWSRRWNLPYSEMCAILLLRPLTRRVGRRGAILASFLVSGLLHEMAISLPVRAGLGLPMLYFALHGGLVLLEDALARGGHPMRGLPGRLWSVVWIVAPLPLLFHRPFVEGVLLPLAGM